ncbi:VPLPA-CTERM sorting domain-containing protein [Rhodobacter sp. KR11]|uniref:VPLPA-CTERM sorting domain-containing protein n=1 Tax=Rhodobacter sp. KR11 TaxID=2974588 RepID=UPI002223C425|nr:VPLPA-CTERM sorting domain-containing protein [Rhodobacter sp. KR11]MCW1919816.1 VPLPA-CTERM sorting domain-containing protein [Rhodobacter sp. KR11]
MTKTFAAIAMALALSAGAASAATLSFNFSFVNAAINGGGTVTGTIAGLNDNATGAATSLKVTGNTNALGFGLGEYAVGAYINTFTVSAGVLTAWNFLQFGKGDTGCCSIRLTSANSLAGLTNATGVVRHPTTDVTITPVVVPTVPVPAGLGLLLSALGGLGVMARRRSRA